MNRPITAAPDPTAQFVAAFRNSAPYINAFRGRTFVVVFGGETIAEERFAGLVHDLALLNSLGIRLVLVHGIRPQVEERLRQRGAEIRYVGGYRLTDDEALRCVKEAVGIARVEIEALLSMGLANSPMAGARIRVASGNFVTARPLGIRDGVDYQHTGEVRRIDVNAIHERLSDGAIVLLSPLGYSPTGEVFNLTAPEVGASAAVSLNADKLIYIGEAPGVPGAKRQLLRQLSVADAEAALHSSRALPEELDAHLRGAVHACTHGVARAHLISRHVDGALLIELFTRDGIGTLVSAELYEGIRKATIDDAAGILELITPLEARGILVRRSREQLEVEIDHFTAVVRDGMIIACAALYPFIQDRMGELACLAVHADYERHGYGKALLEHIEGQAQKLGLEKLFLLTTQTAHWFREHGFVPADLKSLPMKRKALYNYQRNSRVLMKSLQTRR